MVIKVLNLDKLIKNFDKMQEVDMKPFITTATQLVQRTAKDLAPKDTGFLKRSIKRNTYKMGKTVVGRVYTATEYAGWVEFGTTKPHFVPFVIDGQETGLKQWAERHGFDTTEMTGLMVSGKPHPFMIPAMEIHREDIETGAKGFLNYSLGKFKVIK